MPSLVKAGGSASKDAERSLVLEGDVDLGVPASVKFPHLEGNFMTFFVTLGRLISLI